MADIASVALKYTADTSGYIQSLRGAAAANRDFGASLDTSTKADRFRVPDMSAMTAPLQETVRLLREISAIQMQGLSVEKQVAVTRQLQAEEMNRMATAARATVGVGAGGAGAVGQINAETSAIARQLALRKEAAALRVAQNMANARSAEIVREEARETARLAAEESKATAAKVAALNARTSSVSGASRYDNSNPFAQQVMATQKLNALLAQRKTLTDGVERAENRLAITQQVAAVRAQRAYLTVGSNIRKADNTTADSQAKFRQFGLVMQQGGYQVQDFAVQVAGGQNALVAFSQQASQMAGFFGPTGAMVGAGIAVGVLALQMVGLGSETDASKEKQDKYNDTLKEYIRLARERAEIGDPNAKSRFSVQDAQAAQGALQKQLALMPALEANAKLMSEEAEGSLPFSFARRAAKEAKTALSEARDKLFELGAANSAAQLAVEQGADDANRAQFEAAADAAAAESKASADADSRYMNARKENALMEMSNDAQLDYYVREMGFLESIGAKKTEEYELAKRRAREIGTLLLGQSGAGNHEDVKRMEARIRAEKTILGLQTRVPQSLQSNASASATGGFIGRGGGGDMISIQKGILEGIRALVAMERMAGGSN